jgi:RNA polymerase sigma-70 factor (ECF subfamily)
MDQPSATSLRVDRGTGPQDLLVVQGALRGEREAIDAVMRRLGCVVRFVFRLNRSMGYNLPTEGLEDVVQQVYTAVWPRLVDYAGTSALETWVFGFCRNCLRAEFRRRTTRQRFVQGDEEWDEHRSGAPAPEDQALRLEGLDLLQEELALLPALDREMVELRHLHNWSFEQIARQKNLPPSTVKDRCYRALDRIRMRMKRRYGGA